MSDYNTEVYTIRDSEDTVLYVGRRTPGENRSASRCINLINSFRRKLQTEDLHTVSEGFFDNLKDALYLMRNIEVKQLKDYKRPPSRPQLSKVRKRVVKLNVNSRNSFNSFVDFIWNEKSQTFFIEESDFNPDEYLTPP